MYGKIIEKRVKIINENLKMWLLKKCYGEIIFLPSQLSEFLCSDNDENSACIFLKSSVPASLGKK